MALNHPFWELPMRSVVAAVRYGDFGAEVTYWERTAAGQERWITAQALYASKKRFHMRVSMEDFCTAIMDERRLATMTDERNVVWVKAAEHLHFARPTLHD